MAQEKDAKQSGEKFQQFMQEEMRRKVKERLSTVRRKVMILSGKGGVGKSTVAVNTALALHRSGERVGLLDVDIHGPSVPALLGIENATLRAAEDGTLLPFEFQGVKVLSVGFLLPNQDEAVIWRGPLKFQLIRQFLGDAAWGELDFLVLDAPPGTGDEPLTAVQLIPDLDGAVVVTTPQRLAALDVRKSITFCRKLQVPILGVVENMAGFVCPECGTVTHIFPPGGGQKIASDMGVPFLGSIPLDPRLAEAGDQGRSFFDAFGDSPAAEALRKVAEKVAALGAEK